jgi:hypothetical protein
LGKLDQPIHPSINQNSIKKEQGEENQPTRAKKKGERGK